MKTLLLLLLISVSISAGAVNSFVYDKDNNPLENVEVRNIKSGEIVFSDNIGSFTIDGNDTDTIIFLLDGFITTEMTIRNILNSNNRIYLFQQLQHILPEVVVMPANMYELHEKAIFNLKDKLIKNKRISYECERIEKEINVGDERNLALLFTAELGNVNPKNTKLKYKFLLSNLNVVLGAQTSEIMKDNKLYDDNLFFERVRNKLPECKENAMQISDSIIVIYNRYYDETVIVSTINRSDTTLIKVAYELVPDVKRKYRQFRTFKVKEMSYSLSLEFKKNDDGYFLYEKVNNYDYSFLIGKPKVEERIVCLSKITAMTDSLPNATLEIKLDTRKLYNMGNYPLVPGKP